MSRLDFKYILNETRVKKSLKNLKEKLDKGIKFLNNKEKSLQEEKEINLTKKVISVEEHKKRLMN